MTRAWRLWARSTRGPRETKVAARAMEREARRGRQGQKTRAIGRREAESSASIDAIGARETKVAASAMERGRGEGGERRGRELGGRKEALARSA